MSKGLEALYELTRLVKNEKDYFGKALDLRDVIEKELKQAEENEKLLNVFKNALTIEHHDYPMVEIDNSGNVASYLAKELTTIRQNELDKSMRKALREWVLKNAFPKELKALEIIKDFISLEPHCIYGKSKRNLTQEEYDLLKEVLL